MRHPRLSALSLSASSPSLSDMHHRPLPTIRTSSSANSSPRSSPLLPSSTVHCSEKLVTQSASSPTAAQQSADVQASPTICGLPLKYVSLVTLAVQNAALSIVMHYSRVSTPPSLSYSPASAVLLNELLKGAISFIIALSRAPPEPDYIRHRKPFLSHPWSHRLVSVTREVFSPDCWKLSIPAMLYVIQNSLQFVAISNLPVASFQVTYQMKILTTAAFSVALLHRRLSSTKWLSLFFLAIGVGIVQIQTSGVSRSSAPAQVGSAHEYHVHVMRPLRGFGAVTAACFTSGLAGVYFEMVLKGSRADLWVRNVQLSLFSLAPALLPILCSASPPDSRGMLRDLFRNFGGWAWATVAIQVFGGLVTAVVIKYSDNILKGFATSLSIVLSFLASVALFDFKITPSFIIGASTVLSATWMYNQPQSQAEVASAAKKENGIAPDAPILGEFGKKKRVPSPASMYPTPYDSQQSTPYATPYESPRATPYGSPRPSYDGLPPSHVSAVHMHPHSLSPSVSPTTLLPPPVGSYLHPANISPVHNTPGTHSYPHSPSISPSSSISSNGPSGFLLPSHTIQGLTPSSATMLGETLDTPRYLTAPYGSPFPSRAPSPTPSELEQNEAHRRRD